MMKIYNPAAVKQATSLFDVDMNTLRFLGGDDGDVYEAHQGSQDYILKLVPTDEHGVLTLSEKIDFAHYLREHGVKLAQWLPSVDGRLIEVIQADDMVIAVTKMEKVQGHHPNMRNPKEWNSALFRQWGSVLGKMHHLTQDYSGGEHIGHWYDEVAFFVNWCTDPDVETYWNNMNAFLAALPRPNSVYGLIHNDLHQWNYRLENGKIIVFDFDVCGHHWFLTDIAIALFHGLWVDSWKNTQATKERVQRFYDSFIAGYTSENPLEQEWRNRLPYFLKYRQLLSHTVFSDAKSIAHASAWQRRWVAEMHQGIVDNRPVLDLNF